MGRESTGSEGRVLTGGAGPGEGALTGLSICRGKLGPSCHSIHSLIPTSFPPYPSCGPVPNHLSRPPLLMALSLSPLFWYNSPVQVIQRLGQWHVWTTLGRPQGLHFFLDLTDPEQKDVAKEGAN